MRYQIKNVLKKTPIYQYYLRFKDIKKFMLFDDADKQRFKFYQQFIKRGDLVFDVGANMGNRTKIFLKLNARVIAFEPQKYCSDFLSSMLKYEQDFTLIKKALGKKEGKAQMLIANSHTLSTLSESWSKITKESGRFSQYEWNEKQLVQITTLNNAIQEFGKPSFIKIDVEGYEFEVLSGLSNSVDYISIEFTSENIENTYKCIEYVNSLSDVSFQLAIGESMKFHLPTWISQQEIKHILSDIVEQNELAWGDVYIKSSEYP